jgi:hypothetical protein
MNRITQLISVALNVALIIGCAFAIASIAELIGALK